MTILPRHLLQQVVMLAAAGGASVPSWADTLITLDGRRLEGTARFVAPDLVALQPKAPGEPAAVPLAQVLSLEMTASSARTNLASVRVQLVSGCVLPLQSLSRVGSQMEGVQANSVRVAFAFQDVAAIEFAAPSNGGKPAAEIPARLPDAPGALLATGDFLPGALEALTPKMLTLSSTLFGLRTFPLKDLRAIRVRVSQPPASNFLVRLTDGTIALAESLAVRDGALSLVDPTLGSLSAPREAVVSISRSPAMTTSLGALLPAPVDGAVDLRPGADLKVPLDGRYGAMLASFRASPRVLPVTPVRLVILLDGQPAYRSPALTSLDDPVAITLPLSGRAAMILRLEAEMPLGAIGQLEGAMLVLAK